MLVMAYPSSSANGYLCHSTAANSSYQTTPPWHDTASDPSASTSSGHTLLYPVGVQAPPESSFASDANYVYNALLPNQIRLLKLDFTIAIRDFWQPPSCILHTVNLAHAPPYIALSYRWDGNDRIIRINGRDLKIKSNLYEFLCYFRRDAAVSHDTYIWVDQICIDQSNTNERNQQVRFMSRIYKKCTSVTAWLGQDGDTRIAAQSFLRERSRYDLTELLKNPYFDRLWIVQEVLLAPKVRVLCGETWLDFRAMLEVAAEDDYWVTTHIRGVAPFLLWDSLAGRESRTLGKCLERYSGNLTQDPRDKVYGLLGLVEEHERPEADYNKTVAEVCIDALRIVWHRPDGYSRENFNTLAKTLSRNMGLNDRRRDYVTEYRTNIDRSGPRPAWFDWGLGWLEYLTQVPHEEDLDDDASEGEQEHEDSDDENKLEDDQDDEEQDDEDQDKYVHV